MNLLHVKHYRDFGYVHVAESVLRHPLAQCVREFDRCVADADALQLAVDTQPIGATEIRKIAGAARASHVIEAITTNPLLGKMICELTDWVSVFFWADSLYSKPAHSGERSVLGFHQDMQYWREILTPDEAITAVVPLYSAKRESGGVGFVPGSQRWPIVDREIAERSLPWEERYPIVEPGHVTLHHPLTFHGSRENATAEPRRSVSLHFTSRFDIACRQVWLRGLP